MRVEVFSRGLVGRDGVVVRNIERNLRRNRRSLAVIDESYAHGRAPILQYFDSRRNLERRRKELKEQRAEILSRSFIYSVAIAGEPIQCQIRSGGYELKTFYLCFDLFVYVRFIYFFCDWPLSSDRRG